MFFEVECIGVMCDMIFVNFVEDCWVVLDCLLFM